MDEIASRAGYLELPEHETIEAYLNFTYEDLYIDVNTVSLGISNYIYIAAIEKILSLFGKTPDRGWGGDTKEKEAFKLRFAQLFGTVENKRQVFLLRHIFEDAGLSRLFLKLVYPARWEFMEAMRILETMKAQRRDVEDSIEEILLSAPNNRTLGRA